MKKSCFPRIGSCADACSVYSGICRTKSYRYIHLCSSCYSYHRRSGDYEFTTGIDEDGNQNVHLTPKPKSGYSFDHWVIEGPYRTDQPLTDGNLDIIITGDIKVTPYYTINGESPTQAVTTDTSDKSPQTGPSSAMPYIIIGLSLIAVAVSVTIVKSKKSN